MYIKRKSLGEQKPQGHSGGTVLSTISQGVHLRACAGILAAAGHAAATSFPPKPHSRSFPWRLCHSSYVGFAF